MPRVTRKALGLAVAATTVISLTSIGTVGAEAAPTAAAPDTNAVLHLKINDNGTHVSGPTSFAAGRVKLAVQAGGRPRGAELIRLDEGYSFADLRDDIQAFGESYGKNGPSKSGLKHLNHAIDSITAYGGVYANPGETRRAVLLLPSAGEYVVFNDSGDLPKHPTYLNVTSPAGKQYLPETGRIVRVRAHENRWGGDDVLPNKGWVTFQNANTESPHFLVLQHVKESTTREDVLKSFQSNKRPTFIKNGEQDLDFISPHQTMNVKLHLPAGKYAEMCFFPDPKTGEPHAFMGMVNMVHLQ
jgi:hypothetical protein